VTIACQLLPFDTIHSAAYSSSSSTCLTWPNQVTKGEGCARRPLAVRYLKNYPIKFDHTRYITGNAHCVTTTRIQKVNVTQGNFIFAREDSPAYGRVHVGTGMDWPACRATTIVAGQWRIQALADLAAASPLAPP